MEHSARRSQTAAKRAAGAGSAAMGNTAGSGARMLACSRQALERTQALTDSVEALELASAPTFSRCFAQNMRF